MRVRKSLTTNDLREPSQVSPTYEPSQQADVKWIATNGVLCYHLLQLQLWISWRGCQRSLFVPYSWGRTWIFLQWWVEIGRLHAEEAKRAVACWGSRKKHFHSKGFIMNSYVPISSSSSLRPGVERNYLSRFPIFLYTYFPFLSKKFREAMEILIKFRYEASVVNSKIWAKIYIIATE